MVVGVEVMAAAKLATGNPASRLLPTVMRLCRELAVLVADRAAPEEDRIEAIRLLTLLADHRAAPTLAEVMRRGEGRVSAEAAIALGRQRDVRAQSMLVNLIGMEDPHIRTRAAISLARLRDRAAVPGLIDALWVSGDDYDRREAIRWLGQLQDPSAVEPLIGILPETQLRYLTVVALGRIGDVRAYEPLVSTLEWEELTSVRDGVARGLGYLGDRRAIAPLVRLVRDEPDLRMPSESLVRLGALESGEVGGVDMHPEMRGRRLFQRCEAGDANHEWNYLHRTWCETRRQRVRLRLPLPGENSAGENGYWVVVRARRADDPGQAHLQVRLGGEIAGTVPTDGEWSEHRFFVRPDSRPSRAHLDAELSLDDDDATLGIDHVLVIPAAAGTSA